MVVNIRRRVPQTIDQQKENIKSIISPSQTAVRVQQRAACLGFVAGVRMMMPLATLAWNSDQYLPGARPSSFFNRSWLKPFVTMSALGEIVADKLPMAPSRISGGALVLRMLSGGFAGGEICRRFGLNPWSGAFFGTSGAVVGAVTGNNYRLLMQQKTPVPDVIWAMIEDVCTVGLGWLATRR